MKYPNVAVQFDDFEEEYEVVKNRDRISYQTLAKFKLKEHAFDWATTYAVSKELGPVVDSTAE